MDGGKNPTIGTMIVENRFIVRYILPGIYSQDMRKMMLPSEVNGRLSIIEGRCHSESRSNPWKFVFSESVYCSFPVGTLPQRFAMERI